MCRAVISLSMSILSRLSILDLFLFVAGTVLYNHDPHTFKTYPSCLGDIACSIFLIFIISIAYIFIYARLHSRFSLAEVGVKTDDFLGLSLCHTAFID